jgi:hypothetical protein
MRSLRQVSKVRGFATEATAAAEAPVVTKTGSTFGQRLSAFTVGFAVAAGLGLYKVQEDVEKSTKDIQQSITSLKNEIVAQNVALTKRVEQLEPAKEE